MRSRLVILSVWCGVAMAASLRAAPMLVEEGQPRAEIVISDTPARSARLAAAELRETIEKMSGARLPIVTQPSGKGITMVFVGQSSHTRQKGISIDG
ncbi:MAG: hypothetical protein KDL87_16675, partial [Verrucomicrobiae bacterium]|nr:hypothetical protein [Verrucomicrobiae bacterium]